MNKTELLHKLEEKNIPADLYNLTGEGLNDQKMCLLNINNKWQVYYSEKGQQFDFEEFDDENAACEEFWKRLS